MMDKWLRRLNRMVRRHARKFWWRTMWTWARQASFHTTCFVLHRRDHASWDSLMENGSGVYFPGRLCWFCNRCKRSWHTKNIRVLQSELNPGPPIWGEQAAEVYRGRKKEIEEQEREAILKKKLISQGEKESGNR